MDDSIQLPNTTTRAGKGNPLTLEPSLDRASFVHLHQRLSYLGPAWYRRSVEIRLDWQDKDVRLVMERAQASTANEAFPAEMAVDHDPATMWQTDWTRPPVLAANFDRR